MPATVTRIRVDDATKADAVARAKRGESISALAEEVGVTPTSIRNWLKASPSRGAGARSATVRRGGGGSKSVTFREAIETVLRKSRTPLHVEEITRRVLDTAGVKTTGRTPLATVAAILATENLRPNGDFVRTAPATYGVRHRKQRAA